LCAAAVSPQYDLSRVISRCRNGVVNFYSRGDWFILGFGTKSFGTIDRVKCDAAGRVGFQTEDGRLKTISGLTQIAYDPSWVWLGHNGGHFGGLSRRWASEVLAPIIDPPRSDLDGVIREAAAAHAPGPD